MSDEFGQKFITPIVNASYPGTLAALSLTVLQVVNDPPIVLQLTFLAGATFFLMSAFFIFFYSIYPTRKKLWTLTAITFLLGLFASLISVLLLFTTVGPRETEQLVWSYSVLLSLAALL